MRKEELIGSLKLGNVWVFVQLIHRPTRTKNQLYKNPNIALLETSHQLSSLRKRKKERESTHFIFYPRVAFLACFMGSPLPFSTLSFSFEGLLYLTSAQKMGGEVKNTPKRDEGV